MSRFLLLIGAFALVAAACSGEAAVTTTTAIPAAATSTPTSTTSSTSTTTQPLAPTTTIDLSTTVTTVPEGFASPVNGLPAVRDGLLDRGAIVIKVEDHPGARPQSGVNDADSVIEIRVEAGLTRFLSIFHDNESDYVGPVRSLRTTDSTVLAALGTPMAVSGGQPWIQRLHTSRGVGLLKIDTGSSEASIQDEVDFVGERCFNCAFRISARAAPHNLYTRTDLVRGFADARDFTDPPSSLYSIVQWDIPTTTADQITLDWSDATKVRWDWNGEQYVRSYLVQGGYRQHEVIDRDGNTEPIAVDVLVILDGEFYTQFPPPADSDWQAVPATETTGSGSAWVFARGAGWEGTWQRADYPDQFTLLNADGSEAGVPAGFSWVSIFPNHRSVTWE